MLSELSMAIEYSLKQLTWLSILTIIAIFLTWIGPNQPVFATQYNDVQGTVSHRGDNYILQLNDLQLDIDPLHGARITAFRLEGENSLTEQSTDAQNYGSTFWPSPQNTWGWPPIAEIDSEPYTVSVDNSTLLMKSDVSSELDLQITKRFSVDPQRSGISVEYTITNLSDKSRSFAPWEISRVHPEGLTFYPTGDAQLGSGPFDRLITQDMDGITWFKYDSQSIETNQKLYADGAEGWLAHVDGDMLLVKSFQDIPLALQAPTEGEIEIFANASSPYIEIEQQGPYIKIFPQSSLTWIVTWYLRKLPSDLSPEVGSHQLVTFVRDIVMF